LQYIYEPICPGGFFALWENNPWNPIVLYSMKTAELAFNAIPITAPRACQLLQTKFKVLKTDYLFFLPAYLHLQALETWMRKVPLGCPISDSILQGIGSEHDASGLTDLTQQSR